MGIRAEPARVTPDQDLLLERIWADPEGGGRTIRAAWFVCDSYVFPVLDDTARCGLITDAAVKVAGEVADRYRLPVSRLSQSLEEYQMTGGWTITAVMMLCAGDLAEPLPTAGDTVDLRDLHTFCRNGDEAVAYRPVDIVVSGDGIPPNPVFDEIRVNGEILAGDEARTAMTVDCRRADCQRDLSLEVQMDPASYDLVLPDMEWKPPIAIRWYVTSGTLEAGALESWYPEETLSSTWHLEGTGTHELYIIARDRLGSLSFRYIAVQLRAVI